MKDRLFILALVFIVCLTFAVNNTVKNATEFALQKQRQEFLLNLLMFGPRVAPPRSPALQKISVPDYR